jgi:threonine/homoserine/homoserine lactone efflux protein
VEGAAPGPADEGTLVGGVLPSGIHVLLGVVRACALTALAQVLRDRLRRPSVRRRLDRAAGTVIAAFGVRLAFEK